MLVNPFGRVLVIANRLWKSWKVIELHRRRVAQGPYSTAQGVIRKHIASDKNRTSIRFQPIRGVRVFGCSGVYSANHRLRVMTSMTARRFKSTWNIPVCSVDESTLIGPKAHQLSGKTKSGLVSARGGESQVEDHEVSRARFVSHECCPVFTGTGMCGEVGDIQLL